MKTPAQIIDEVITKEGGYVDHPHDLGGPTKYGITEDVARRHGYQADMRDLPLMTAKMIYMRQYWTRPGFNEVSKLSNPVAAKLFDIGVNMGTGFASRSLQRLLNLFTDMVLKVDGQIGPLTLNALHVYLSKRKHEEPHETMVKAITSLQGCRYIHITEKRPENRSFFQGWMRHRL